MNTNPGEWIYDPDLQREVTTTPANDEYACHAGNATCLYLSTRIGDRTNTRVGSECVERVCCLYEPNHVIWVDRTTWPIARLTKKS